MNEPVEYLDLEDVVDLARTLLGGPPPIRDIGLLGSAVARPRTNLLGDDAYPDVWSKAASLLQSIVNDPALIEGNKRLGWLCTAVFLELNEASVAGASNDDVYDLVIDVATNHRPVDDIAARLKTSSSAPRGR